MVVRVGRITAYPPGIIEYRQPKTAAAAGWWVVAGKTCVAAYAPKGAATYAASLANLASPGTYDATEGVAPDWNTSTGWTFSGFPHNEYLTTSITGISRTWSIFVQFSGVSGNGPLFGADYPNNNCHVWVNYSGTRYYRFFVDASKAGGVTAGNIGMTNGNGWLNGASDLTFTSATGSTTGALDIGRFGIAYATATISAFAVYSNTLVSGEIATLAAAMAAL